MTDATPTPADRPADQLRALIAEALLGWAETNSSPQYARMRRPETVVANAYGRADAVLAALPAPALAVARQLLGTSTGEDTDAAELTAEEARDLVDELNTELYQARDALAFVGECCDIADRNQRPITTGDVREWLKGARCGRQLLGTTEGEGSPSPAAAPLAEVWTVWREDEPVYAHYTTEADARQGTIDCWQDDEPVCPDYSWRQDGPRLELVVGGEHAGVYASRHRVYGAPPAPADRAAVLREAANGLAALGPLDNLVSAPAAWNEAIETLRRMADQMADDAAAGVQPPTTTEAHPAEHTWAAELHDPIANEWVPFGSSNVRDTAVHRLARARKVAPVWADGTPTERRLVRATTTYTVEPTEPPTHLPKGTNAEDCPACKGTNPDYPFLCPTPPAAPAAPEEQR